MQELEVLVPHQSTKTTPSEARAVIIVGPPWPRSGTGRGMQNQVDYYRSRGYFVIFISVPVHCSYTEGHPDWDGLRTGMQEFGADRTFHAYIDQRRFSLAKYTEWLKLGFHGTALDWIVFTAASAHISEEAHDFIRNAHISLVHVNHVFTLEFVRKLLKRSIPSGEKIPMILETHDIQSYALKERGEVNGWTHRIDRVESLVRSEIARLKSVGVFIHVSTDDCEFFKKHLPDKQHVLSMPTIHENFVLDVRSTPAPSVKRFDLLFVGHDTAPNAAALEWFFGQVWPLLAGEGYQLKIVGSIAKSAHQGVRELHRRFSSSFVGEVASLNPFYSATRCVIAPMVSGTGISCKTIEALALGKPFVGTSKAYRGMPADALGELGLLAHDTPESFANAIGNALRMEEAAGAASRMAYLRLFSNEVSFTARDEAVRLAMSATTRVS